MESAASTFDLLQDISGAGGPDERLGALVVVIDVVSDRGDEFFDIAKDAAAQPVLSPIPSLDLTLLIQTQHQSVLGWVQVQAYDIGQLLGKLGIPTHLEGLQQMRF